MSTRNDGWNNHTIYIFLDNPANMPCRLSVVSVNLRSVDLLFVTGTYLSNPRVPVSPPHYMPTLVLFHCILNSVSGSLGLWDCSVITRRRLFLSGFSACHGSYPVGCLQGHCLRAWGGDSSNIQDRAERQGGGKRWTAEDGWATQQVFYKSFYTTSLCTQCTEEGGMLCTVPLPDFFWLFSVTFTWFRSSNKFEHYTKITSTKCNF